MRYELRAKHGLKGKFHREFSIHSLQTSVIVLLSSDIAVGDIIIIERDRRVPADVVLLRTSEKVR